MNFPSGEPFADSSDPRFRVAQERLRQINVEAPTPGDIRVLALLDTDSILAKDYATLQLISDSPDSNTLPQTEEAAAYVALTEIATRALVEREAPAGIRALRGDEAKLKVFLFGVTEGVRPDLYAQLDSLLIDAIRNNDAATLDVVVSYCQHAMSPAVTSDDELVKRGKYRAVTTVGLLGLERHIPEVAIGDLAILALLREHGRIGTHKTRSELTPDEITLAHRGLVGIRYLGEICFLNVTPRGRSVLAKQLPYAD